MTDFFHSQPAEAYHRKIAVSPGFRVVLTSAA
jgi:hypothetical protein